MLYNIGNNLKDATRRRPRKPSPKGYANAYLSGLFGWSPLFDDISTLLDVSSYISRRNRELHKLFEGRGTRSRIDYGAQHNTFEDVQFLESGWPFGVLGATRKVVTSDHIWGTVRWKPTTSPGWHPSEEEYLALAKKVVSGATASGAFASAWDLIPWTWLLGWLVNVRSFVLANGNTVPAAPGPVCLMRETRSIQTFVPSNPGGFLRTGTITNWIKNRYIFPDGATFGAFLPHLDAGRLSVLSALAVQRLR
jgi:hypothetical protein